VAVGKLWGVGKVTEEVLVGAGIRTAGDVQRWPATRLAALVGAASAAALQALARGEDDREIALDIEEKSLSREHTFKEDCTDVALLEETLAGLAESVGRRLRAAGKFGRTAHLKLRWKGFETITRQRPFVQACCDDFSLRAMALELFRAQVLVKPVRLLGFGVSQLTTTRPPRQIELFAPAVLPEERRERVSRAVDSLRAKFGRGAIGRPPTVAGGADVEDD